MPNNISDVKLIIVTGLSGAGHSMALKILEDFGYHAIDNVPVELLMPLIEKFKKLHPDGKLAVGADMRTLGFSNRHISKHCSSSSKSLKGFIGDPGKYMDSRGKPENDEVELECSENQFRKNSIVSLKSLCSQFNKQQHILFLECENAILLHRYSESRRPHPLQLSNLDECIQLEREILKPIQEISNSVIDTSNLSIPELRQHLGGLFKRGEKDSPDILVHSFSYRNGIPRNADIVLDARFLQNPFYDPKLRSLTGQDKYVQELLLSDPLWKNHFEAVKTMISLSLEGFLKNNRSYVIIAVGCTGGQHRSVFMAEKISKVLKEQGYQTTLHHNELERKGI